MSRMRYSNSLIAISFIAISTAIAGCSTEAAFESRQSKITKEPNSGDAKGKASQLPTANDATTSNEKPIIVPSPDPPINHDSPFAPLALRVKAGELASGMLFKPTIAAHNVGIDTKQFPVGHFFNKNNGQFRYQTDFQDIARPGSYRLTGTYEGDDYQSTLEISVDPPTVAAKTCFYQPEPVIGAVAPREKWHWNGWQKSSSDPRYYITYSSPVAGDLDGNGSVEIVSVPSTSAYHTGNGPVVVLAGETGEVLWNSMLALNQGVAVSTTPVIADLNKDGFAEIIAVAAKPSGFEIIAFDWKTKSIKWRYDTDFICSTYCMAAVADIDADGKAEIVAGNVILNDEGHLQNKLLPTPTNAVPPTTTLYDLDPNSPGLEIVANGSQVYKSDGTRLWTGSCSGYSGAADIDRDGAAEVVCVGGGKVDVYTNSGVRKWVAEIPMSPGVNTLGGAPNIGNFAGDGAFEIGTAGGDYYVVYDKNGVELWRRPTNDRSSHRTGSTIFDFNGDGKVEVVYNDQDKLRIYDGANGTILWDIANPSGTLWEYPLVVNVDQDASVEIVVSAPSLGGVRVFDDPSNLWVSSRRLWNQYSYYPELVDEKLLATRSPGAAKEGFRINTQGAVLSGDKILLPDLTVMPPQFADDRLTDPAQSGPDLRSNLTFFITNQGQAPAIGPTKVFLVDQEGNVLGTTSWLSDIASAAGAKVQIQGIESTKLIDRTLTAIVGTLEATTSTTPALQARECIATNNVVNFKLQKLDRTTPGP